MKAITRNRQLQNIYHSAFLKGRLHPVTLLTGSLSDSLVEWVFQFAQLILCERNGLLENENACRVCGSCIRVEKRASESILHLKPEGLQFKVDEARRALQYVTLQNTSRARLIIFERTDLLNPQAANILLKTLEEPPEKTLFFLLSPSPQDVMITLRSRAQMMKLIPEAGSIQSPLLESQSTDWTDTRVLARNLLGDIALHSYAPFFARWKGDVTDRETAIAVIQLWQELVRDVIFLKLKASDRAKLSVLHAEEAAILSDTFKKLSVEDLQNLFQLTHEAERDVKSNVDRTLAIEKIWQDPMWKNSGKLGFR